MQRCTIAATQVDVRHLDVEHNLETHLRLIAETAEAGCDLVVFPEMSVTGHNGDPEVTRFAEPHDGRIFRTLQRAGEGVRDRRLVRVLRALPRDALQHVGPRRPRRPDRAAAQGARLLRRVLPLPPGLRVGRLQPRLLHGRDRDLPRQRLLRELAGARPEGRRGDPAAAREPDDAGGRRRSSRSTGASGSCRKRRSCAPRRSCSRTRPSPPRLHDLLARDNGVYAVFSDMVGFDGHSTHVGGAYILAPDGAMAARSEVRLRRPLDRRRARSRTARTGPREPVVRPQETAAGGLRRAGRPPVRKDAAS